MPAAPSPLTPPSVPWTDPSTGLPSQSFRIYVSSLDALARLLASGNVGPLIGAANDGAAKAAGVAVGGLYQNGGIVRVRLT